LAVGIDEENEEDPPKLRWRAEFCRDTGLFPR
jgi:hypothetical protein